MKITNTGYINFYAYNIEYYEVDSLISKGKLLDPQKIAEIGYFKQKYLIGGPLNGTDP